MKHQAYWIQYDWLNSIRPWSMPYRTKDYICYFSQWPGTNYTYICSLCRIAKVQYCVLWYYLWIPLHPLPREDVAKNGIKHVNKSTSNLLVEPLDVNKKYGPIVYVMLGSGCVNIALKIISLMLLNDCNLIIRKITRMSNVLGVWAWKTKRYFYLL